MDKNVSSNPQTQPHPLSTPQEMKEVKPPTTPTTTTTTTNTTNKVNDMSPEEQTKYYKDLFMKSKKLILHYEENMKSKDEIIKNLKTKLKGYEAEDGKTCEFLFKFIYEDSNFFFFKNDKSHVCIFI